MTVTHILQGASSAIATSLARRKFLENSQVSDSDSDSDNSDDHAAWA